MRRHYKGSEVNVARSRRCVFLLHSHDGSLFPSSCTEVVEGNEAFLRHTELKLHTPTIPPLVIVREALVRPVYDCLRDEGFGLNQRASFCYALNEGFFSLLVFERGIKRVPRSAQIEELFSATAESLHFVVQNKKTVDVFAKGLDRTRVPTEHLESYRGRLRAYC